MALAGKLTGLECHPDIQVCGYDPWSGRKQESTNACISKWNYKLMSFSLSLSPSSVSLKSINKTEKREEWVNSGEED